MFLTEGTGGCFKHMARSFVAPDPAFDEVGMVDGISEPFCYGYIGTAGPDGRPMAGKYGSPGPGRLPVSDARHPTVETIAGDNQKLVGISGVEKSDATIMAGGKTASMGAERGKKKYRATVPVRPITDAGSTGASYKKWIGLTFKQLENPKGTWWRRGNLPLSTGDVL